ncbi:MAG: hypothetical protein L3J36_04745 [Rhodobacteraceae bacterium]|nr:hypothetical protein [Paracoccaceae bacterium]
MNRVGLWVFGLIGSVVAHVGLLALMIFAVQPDPIADQPLPTSKLEVLAYQLDRTKAQEQQPESEQTDANTPDGQTLDADAIPKSKARVAQPKAEQLRPDAPPAPAAPEVAKPVQVVARIIPAIARLSASSQPTPLVEPTQVTPASLAASIAPTVSAFQAVVRVQSVLPIAQPAVAVMPISPPQGPIVLAALPDVALAPTIAPAASPAPVTQPDLTALPIAQPAPVAIPQAAAESDPVVPAVPDIVAALAQQSDAPLFQPTTPNAQKLKAALAFSGGEGDVDPVSIAAFQSFMQPGDIATSDDQLRDGVAGLLAQVPCSRMQVSFDPVTATLQVKGHIPDDDLRAPVLAALRVQMGANITVSDNILILPRPQCGALSGIAGVGLPQSTDQITNPLVIGNDTHAKVFNFAEGDLLSLDMTAPDYDAFIYLDYFDADGMVLHLEPNEYAPLRQTNAQAAQQIGAKTMQDIGLKLVIAPPYGQEIAVAFAASEPLYEGLRPIQEPAAEYLVWLQEQVAKARAKNADFKGEWVYFFVSTAAR